MLLVIPVFRLVTMTRKSGDETVWMIGALAATLRLANCGDNACSGSATPALDFLSNIGRMDEEDPVSIDVGMTVEFVKGEGDLTGHDEFDTVVITAEKLLEC